MNRTIAAITLASFVSSSLAPGIALGDMLDRASEEAEQLQAPSDLNADEAIGAPAATADSPNGPPVDLQQSSGARGQTDRITADYSTVPPDAPVADPETQTLDLPTGPAKNGVTSQSISVPKGSGTIDGMGESFSTQLSTGVATFSVPFPLPSARGGAQPSLTLAYSSASGPGEAGLGWSVGTPFIARQTDRGLPGYDDRASWHPSQDRFVFNGGQELVPICTVSNDLACDCTTGTDGVCRGGAAQDEEMPSWSEGSQYFRARVEGAFLRFFWAPNHLTWRVQDKGGTTMELGVPLDGSADTSALERNPDDLSEVYKWYLVRQYDRYGDANPATASVQPKPFNVVVYKYIQNGGAAYLSDIFDTTPIAAKDTLDLRRYAHHTHLDYETRSDPTFSYRTGWRIDRRLRLRRVDVSSKTFNDGEGGPRRLVRRHHLAYDATSHVSLLASVQVEGRCSGVEVDATPEAANAELPPTSCPRLPPMTFAYSRVTPFTTSGEPDIADLPGYEGFDARVRQISGDPEHSIDNALADLFDVNSDGLPDLLVTDATKYGNAHGLFFNSAKGKPDSFGSPQSMPVRGVLGANATTIKLDNLNLAALDLDGDATVDLLHMPRLKTYSIYTPHFGAGGWEWTGREVTTASQQSPKIDFGKDTLDTKIADVNFDGLVDVVVTTGTEIETFFALGRYAHGDGQFGKGSRTGAVTSAISNDPVTACKLHSGNDVRLSDSDIRIAEMNGDGIPDIVRMRKGDIRYWPGRGNGFWGIGRRDDCPANPDRAGENRYLQMADSPSYADVQATTLRMDDVNGDGLDDLLEVGPLDVDVWLNVDGVGWTERHVIEDPPPVAPYADRVRLVDVNGSGTRDLLWGEGRYYKYIDLQGGQMARLLTRVENGLGKSTDIEYTTSTAEMLGAEAHGGACDAATKPWSSPWCSKMPIVAQVVKRVTESDNLVVAGKGPGRYVTEYAYRDPVYDGRQREFRGFRKSRSTRIGDENSPTDFTESTFLLGECKDETADGMDDCAAPWLDNGREALKGLPTLVERYDERGVYLSSETSTYRLRHLYTGLDGRAVRYAFDRAKRQYVYDTALGAAVDSPAEVSFASVEIEPQCNDFDAEADDPLATPENVTNDETGTLLVRQPAGRAEIASSTIVDCAGNRLVSIAHGCVAGSACPSAQIGMGPDETIFSYTEPVNLGGWLWRTESSFVKGSVHTEVRRHTRTTYTAEGAPDQTFAMLDGVLPLDRVHPESLPDDASEGGEIAISSRTYSDVGQLEQEGGANGRCHAIGYEEAYEAFPISDTIHKNGSGACDDPDALVVKAAAYDRGLGLITTALDMQLQATNAAYDGFGRLSELTRPLSGGGNPLPSVKVEYVLPSLENPVRYSVIHTSVQDGARSSDDSYMESYAYLDGMGRTLVTLSEAEQEELEDGELGPPRWIAGNLRGYDAKNALCRKYLNFFYMGDPLGFLFAAAPASPNGAQRYDAFGRQLQTFDIDGTLTLQSKHHALSTDLLDAADLEPGPHQGTPATIRNDGHGRAISSTERVHVGGSIEERHIRTQYLTTGEPEIITRVRDAGPDKVVRWMRYDTLGRMVLNVEPNTSKNFSDNPAIELAASGLKAWRYAYDDAGDLVGTSDARGCGQNFFYDGVGRLTGEDYAPCEGHHADYSVPDADPETKSGFEVLYVYDKVPATLMPAFQRPPNYATDSSFLRGRLAAVFSRGSTTWTKYDERGRVVRVDVRIAKPNTDTVSFAGRYAPSWYTKDFAYDAADREVATTTGSTRSNLQGDEIASYGFDPGRNKSVVTTHYNARGAVQSVDGSFGLLVGSIDRSADGLVNQVAYGDRAHTTTAFSYDNRRRLRNLQTYRAPAEIWNSPPALYQPAPDLDETTSFQLILRDEDFTYDSVSNPIEIRDWRDPDEWPSGAKPVTQEIHYDDLNRVKRVDYKHAGGEDSWTSPFAAELDGSEDPRRGLPSPHIAFDSRIKWQAFDYDWLGNTSKTDDDASGFYDRSLGSITNDIAGGKPYQLKSATNNASGGSRTGTTTALYDDAGNLKRLNVGRNGPCIDGDCSQRFDYRWDEVGRLVRARRWDVAAVSMSPGDPLPPDAQSDADLVYAYNESDERVLKSTGNGASHTVYIFESLELRRTDYDGANYAQTTGADDGLTESEVAYLFANGARLARVEFERHVDSEPRLGGSSRQHVFLELADQLNSTSIVLDRATGELVERASFQAYGATESDYRPDRWEGSREDYRFTGKEEDIEVGLQYFGKRFLSPNLGRWLSADPLAVHGSEADLNAYAYVRGRVLAATDALGLQDDVTYVNTMPADIPAEVRQAAESGQPLRWTADPAPDNVPGTRMGFESEVQGAQRSGQQIFEYRKDAALSFEDAVYFERVRYEVKNRLGSYSWIPEPNTPDDVSPEPVPEVPSGRWFELRMPSWQADLSQQMGEGRAWDYFARDMELHYLVRGKLDVCHNLCVGGEAGLFIPGYDDPSEKTIPYAKPTAKVGNQQGGNVAAQAGVYFGSYEEFKKKTSYSLSLGVVRATVFQNGTQDWLPLPRLTGVVFDVVRLGGKLEEQKSRDVTFSVSPGEDLGIKK